MQPNIRVMLFDEDGERFSVRDKCRLLHAIEQTDRFAPPRSPCRWHTPRRFGLVQCHAEQVLGFTHRAQNRRQEAAGSVLTDGAKEFLYRWGAVS